VRRSRIQYALLNDKALNHLLHVADERIVCDMAESVGYHDTHVIGLGLMPSTGRDVKGVGKVFDC